MASPSNKTRLTEAAYQCLPGGPVDVDKEFYDKVAATASSEPPLRSLVESFVLPIRSGKAWEMQKGDICRIVAVEGAQVGDLNIWSLHNPRERFWASRTIARAMNVNTKETRGGGKNISKMEFNCLSLCV
ncbi:hypothetical protein EV361DRAFT_927936 [Lentinula raphanica]|nr:hypothetical protein EV361DRAFT_927936 [Lentinula raphanica]